MFTVMLQNTTLYTIELLKLLLSCCFISNIKFNHKNIALGSFLLSILVFFNLSYFFDISNSGIPYALLPIILIFIFMSKKKKIGLVFLNYFIYCMLDVTFCSIVMFILNITSDTIIHSFALTLLINSFSLIPITIFSIILFSKKNHQPDYNISKKLILIFITGAFTLTMYISFFQVFIFTDTPNSYQNMIGLCVSLSSFIFIFVCILLLFKQNQNNHLKKEAEMNLELMKNQENYYTMLLEKSNETQAFRHDIQHHIYSLQILYKNNDYKEIGNYLKQLNNSLQELKTTLQTGNNLINAIALDISNKYKNIPLNWSGQLPDSLSISSMDLCTIFSNLLKNAFEASDKSNLKYVNVSIRRLESNLFITIENPTLTIPTIMNNTYQTTKNEPGHGYGIKNVQKCITKNSGFFQTSYNNGIFTAEITLMNAIKL